jgi:hypothetical protein
MSSLFSPRMLRLRQAARQTIETDRYCRSCGQNLRGLKGGSRCPECGTPMELDPALTDVLLSGDADERARWRSGLFIAFACLATIIVARLAVFFAGAGGADLTRPYLGLVGVISAAWVLATWLITPNLIAQRGYATTWLLLVIRLSQPAWLAAFGVLAIVQLGAPAQPLENWLRAAGALGRVIGGIGVILLAIVLCRVAIEAELDDAARRMNAAIWLLPPTTLLVQLFPDVLPWVWLVPLGMFLLAWCCVMWVFARGVLDLHRHVAWGVSHAHDQIHRTARMTRTREELDHQVRSRVRPPPSDPGDLPLEPAQPARAARRAGERR